MGTVAVAGLGIAAGTDIDWTDDCSYLDFQNYTYFVHHIVFVAVAPSAGWVGTAFAMEGIGYFEASFDHTGQLVVAGSGDTSFAAAAAVVRLGTADVVVARSGVVDTCCSCHSYHASRGLP